MSWTFGVRCYQILQMQFFQKIWMMTHFLCKWTRLCKKKRVLWHSQQQFLDPCVVKNFQEKWYSAYCTAEKKTHGLLFSIGLSGRKIRNVAPRFIEIYEQLPSKLQAHNNQLASQKAADAAKLILPVEGKCLTNNNFDVSQRKSTIILFLPGRDWKNHYHHRLCQISSEKENLYAGRHFSSVIYQRICRRNE